MSRSVGDSDSLRRQNRGLVLAALRLSGPLSRTVLAGATGLSHASITAITHDMIAQQVIEEIAFGEKSDTKARGRPATQIGFTRNAGYVALFEIEVNRIRLSLVDYRGTLIDRIDAPLGPKSLDQVSPSGFMLEQVDKLRHRNPAQTARLRRIAISVQGILARDATGLKWSPIQNIAGAPFVTELSEQLQVPVALFKRGPLLAEGARWLDPSLRDASVATVFIGATVAMGMTFRGQILGRTDDGATEFGHMNHIPNGAVCRCGMLGCIEAYASDYGVLRTAFSVPETTAPAAAVPPEQYAALIRRAQAGDRVATNAFRVAGRAIGFGLSRIMSVFDPSHILIVGPGAQAFALMASEIDAALAGTLVCKVNGPPKIVAHLEDREPVFQALMMKTLYEMDQNDIAPLTHRDAATTPA